MRRNIGLNPNGLDIAFPFHFIVDRNGLICQCGPSIARACPTFVPGASVDDLVRLVRPPMPFCARDLFESAPEFVVIEIGHSGLVLRGQTLAQGDVLLFLGSPWLTAPQQVEEHRLRVVDFALHDPALDYLSLLETKNSALSDASKFADAMNEANARLSALIAGLPYGVLVESEESKIALTNEAFCAMFGIAAPPSALIGADCRGSAEDAKHLFKDPHGFLAGIEQRLRDDVPVSGEVLDLRDGRTFERDYVPIRNGKHRGRLWQYRNVTERRKSENELRAARARAEEANEEKSLFLAMMSHEMRTPLGVIVGLSDLLCEPLEQADRTDYIRRLRANADALLSLIDDVLDFSKLEAGGIELADAPFDALELARDVTSSLALKAERKGLEMRLKHDEAARLSLSGDEGRLRQVLVNLVNNAIKFTDEGWVELSVSVVSRSPNQVRVRYAVSDSGRGIPAALHERIFERFVRVDTSNRPRAEGTGLGLSISRALVERMGGSIELKSEPGKGSCFSFEVDHTATYSEWPVAPTTEPVEKPRFAGRILLAEDDPDNREIMRRTLCQAGYEVDTAIDGSVAYEKARTLDYDLLLTDVQMPTMDGLELTRRLRGIEKSAMRPRLSIVAITAHAVESYRKQGLDAGMDAYLTKPIRRMDLIDAVERHIDRRPRVMVVDDSLDSLVVTSRMLSRTGQVRVVAVADGQGAVLRASRTPFDLILLDASMAGMNGEETAKAIRAMPSARLTRIVAFTGHGPGPEVQKLMDAGCDDYLQKPVNNATLQAMVKKHALDVPRPTPSLAPKQPASLLAALNFDEDVVDLVPGYLKHRRGDIEVLRRVLEANGAPSDAKAIGHQLKGSGKAYGLPEISEIGARIEMWAGSGEREELRTLTSRLELYVANVERELEARFGANTGPS